MPGPPKKPTSLKSLHGNPGKQKKNAREPKPRKAPVRCPGWLDDQAKAEWKRVCPELENLNLMTVVDRAVLAGYCQSWSDYHRAVRMVREQGETIMTPNDMLAKNPWVTIKNEAWARYNKAAQQFGFTPASRPNLQAPADDAPEGASLLSYINAEGPQKKDRQA